MIISRTPYRISFFGGGTDYPTWSDQHGGAVLATTIDKYCYLTCRYLPPFFEHKHRIVWSRIETCNSLDQIVHPAAREILRFLEIERGVEIHHVGDLPARSGMGSSSSFAVGLLHAVHALKGFMPTKDQLAREGIHIEREVLRETVGCQDQILAAHGGFNYIRFHPGGGHTVHPVLISRERVQELNDHLMLFYSGIKRTASEVADSYALDLDARQAQMRFMHQLVDRGLELLNSCQDLGAFGGLLHEAWMAKRSLSARVSNPLVDELYGRARQAGATGGKLTGAGGGGFLVLFAPPARQAQVRAALRDLIHVPFRFDTTGSQIIAFNREEDYSLLEAGPVSPDFRELADIREVI
jgi:D-glycero-alpha-D-manno-heptose-7-phosphate kinase